MDNKKKSLIAKDYYRIFGRWPKGLILREFRQPNFKYMYFFRKASKYKKFSLLGIFYRLLLKSYQKKYGYQIEAGTKIGEGFYIGHWGTVIVNGMAVIGKNCNISAGVTIGQTNRGPRKGCPTIGDKVWIGTNSVIVGKINIGSNVLIAPLSYVNFDVPDNSIVIGSKIKYSETATEHYICNIV